MVRRPTTVQKRNIIYLSFGAKDQPMINEVIENVYYKGELYYAESIAIATTAGNTYRIYTDGYEKVPRDEIVGYSIDYINNLTGLTIIKEGHNYEQILIELSDKRFIEFYRCSGLIDFLEGRDYKAENEYDIHPVEEYDEYKQIIDDRNI